MSLTYRKSYYVKHPIVLMQTIYRNLKYYHQRGKRGYADCDVWSLDRYLAEWMPEALSSLIKQLHGHPTTLCPCDTDHLTHKNCNGDEVWPAILAEIRDGFLAARIIEDTWDFDRGSDNWKKFDRGMELFHTHYHSLWD